MTSEDYEMRFYKNTDLNQLGRLYVGNFGPQEDCLGLAPVDLADYFDIFRVVPEVDLVIGQMIGDLFWSRGDV